MLKAIRVLIVEDRSPDAELMAFELRRAGFALEWERVETEADYLAHLETKPDVILADHNLPQFGAQRALALLKARGLDIPFIVVTGSISEEVAVRRIKEGATDYLLKDRLARLGPAVVQALEQKQIRDERKRAEAQMRMQSAALASAANGILITDREGIATWVNPAFSKLTGYSFEEIVGRNPRLLKSDAQNREFYDNLWKTILAGKVWSGETVNRRKDGSLYIEEQSITPVRDDKGEISHFIAIKQDITERKRAEKEVQRNLQRIHALREIDVAIGSTLDLRAVLDILLKKIELFIPIAAASSVRLFNRATGDLEALACRGIDERAWKALRPGVAITAAQRVAETRAPLKVLNLRTSSLTPDPELARQWGLISYLGVPLIADNRVLGVLNLYTRQEHDFSDEEIEFFNTLAGQAAIAIHNAQLYETIIHSKSALEMSNLNLETSVKQLSGLYTVLTPLAPSESIDETLSRIVDRLVEATGSDAALIRLRDKVMGQYIITGHRGFPDEHVARVKAAPAEGAVDWVIKEGQPLIAPDIASDPRFKSKMQIEQGFLSCAILPLKVQNEVRGIMHIASRQIGYFDEEQKEHLMAIARQMGIALENKELFETLRASRDELEKANKIKDDFLNVMSHELKTPLVVIMGYAEVLKNETIGALNEQQQNALERMLGCAGEQLSIINNILETIHLKANAIAPEYQVLNVTLLLDALKSEYEIRAGKRNLSIGWTYPATPVEMVTDVTKLKQILHNLINNAVKFTEQGSVRISATRLEDEEIIEFRVSDTGIGIPKEMQEVIFEKFHQLDSSDTRRYGGVGLGLHIVKQLTEVLHGTVRVESEPGKGSAFIVRLPRLGAALTTEERQKDNSVQSEQPSLHSL